MESTAEKTDFSKVPAQIVKNVMELEFNVPWHLTSVTSKDSPNVWYAYMADRNGNTVDLDTDCVKFVIECVNRHSDCLDSMMKIYRKCSESGLKAEELEEIKKTAFEYCKRQLIADGYVKEDSETADQEAEEFIFGDEDDGDGDTDDGIS